MDAPAAGATGLTKKQKYWLIGGLIFLLLLAGTLVWYFKYYKPKKNADKAFNLFTLFVSAVTPEEAGTLRMNLDDLGYTIGDNADKTGWILIDKNGNTVAEAKVQAAA